MNHKVRVVEELYMAAKQLYEDGVISGDSSSADNILRNLYQGIENLKENWKGADAGLRIQEVITVYNSMVVVRNNLVSLAADSAQIAINYRKIQISNGTRLGEFNEIAVESKDKLSDYFDNADTIDINPEAEIGKKFIDTANGMLDSFEAVVRSKYNDIMSNWLAGPGRGEAESSFQAYMSNVKNYKSKLAEVSENVTNALQNYDF